MRLGSLLGGVIMAAAIPLFSAQAAPQMLGLMTAEAMPLTCENGVCTAELTAFCLQETRQPPRGGTAYTPVEPERITLVGRRADGSRFSRKVGAVVRLTARRSHYAVTATLPQSLIDSMGAVEAAITVGPNVSLIPVVVADDPNPLTEQEIAHAVKELRPAAADVVDGDAPMAKAARVVTRLLNVLPKGGLDQAGRQSLWNKIAAASGTSERADPGLRQAGDIFRMCQSMPGDMFRKCLERFHDTKMARTNIRYWRLVGAGV